MSKKFLVWSLIMAVLLGIVQTSVVTAAGAASPAPAAAEGKVVKFQYLQLSSSGGTAWTDKDGTMHIRDRTDFGLIEGSLNGYAQVVFNCDLDPNGDGEEYGTITIYETDPGQVKQIAWIGTWVHKIAGGMDVDGRLTARGVGVNEGLLLRITKVYRVLIEKKLVEINIGRIVILP